METLWQSGSRSTYERNFQPLEIIQLRVAHSPEGGTVRADGDNDGKLERSCRNTAAGKLGDRARYGGTYVEYPDNHGEVRHPPKKSQTANRKDLKQLLRFFVSKDEEVDPFLDSCIKEANAIYSLGIQVKVSKALLSNPDRYARISPHRESRDSKFQKNPNVQDPS